MMWWEKTVEYAFVVEAFRAGRCAFAAPLSGKHERLASDAVFGTPSSFVLIEFKRTAEDIPTEKSLFHDFDRAKELLEQFDHHHIVYGAESKMLQGTLELFAETYFSGIPRISAVDCLNHGTAPERFQEYLVHLAKLKKEDGRSGGGHVSPEALSTVLGVGKKGELVSAQPLYEFAPKLFPVPVVRTDYTPPPPAEHPAPAPF